MRHRLLIAVLTAVLALLLAPTSLLAAEPQQETQRFFMRNGGTGCPGAPFLSPQPGAGEPGCGYLGGAPLGELYHAGVWESSTIKTYVGNEGLPLELDATRDLTGNVRVVSSATSNRMAVGQVRVDVTVRGRFGNQTVALGTDSETVVINPTNSAEVDFPFTVDLPDERHGQNVTELSIDVDIRGVHVLTGYHRLNGQSWLDLPHWVHEGV